MDSQSWSSRREPPPRASTLQCTALPKRDIVNIPPRPWAYGHFLLFGKAAALAAVDGGGKGAMTVAVILSIITGKPLLGEKVWRTGPVAIVTYEDDEDEWNRRIAAACIHYDLADQYDFILDNIRFITHSNADRVCFGVNSERGSFTSGDADDVITLVKEFQAVAIIVDPFNLCHAMEDGNNNVVIARIAAVLNYICKETNCAGLVLHHLRKGSKGEIDDIMGATSLRATFRSCRLLAKMAPDEAGELKIHKTEAWAYSRIASVKSNYAPPPDQAVWFRLVSVALGNGDGDIYPDGDSVGVTTSWTPPSSDDGMDYETLEAVFDAIGKTHHTNVRQSKHTAWVGMPLITIGDQSEAQAKATIKTWIENGVLIKGKYTHAESKNSVSCVTLDAAKVVKILADMNRFQAPPTD